MNVLCCVGDNGLFSFELFLRSETVITILVQFKVEMPNFDGKILGNTLS